MKHRRGFIRQTGHVLYEVGFAIGSLASRVLNATVLRGSMHQTTSARAYLESHPYGDIPPRDAWVQFDKAINGLFWALSLGSVANHTKQSRDADVLRMKRGLYRYGEGPDPDA